MLDIFQVPYICGSCTISFKSCRLQYRPLRRFYWLLYSRIGRNRTPELEILAASTKLTGPTIVARGPTTMAVACWLASVPVKGTVQEWTKGRHTCRDIDRADLGGGP